MEEHGSDEAELNDSLYNHGGNYVNRNSENEMNEEDCEPCDGEPLREQDRFLPTANVARIMKKAIPKSGKIAKEAKDCVQECVSEFVSFITSEASDRCQQEKRKTINGEDILYAMSTLGFDNYIEPLKVYLQKYRDSTKSEKTFVEDKIVELNAEDSYGSVLLADQSLIFTTSNTSQQSFG